MIDYNLVKKRMYEIEKTKEQASFRKLNYWLKQGSSTLRFITPPNEKFPFKYGVIYYDIKRFPIVWLDDYGVDPIRESLDALLRSGDEINVEFAKKHYPIKRAFAVAVVRSSDYTDPVWVALPMSVEQQLIAYLYNIEDYGDITDVHTGRDFIITRTKGSGGLKTDYLVQPKGKPTPLANTEQEIKRILENIPKIEEAYTIYNYDELKKVWTEYLNGDTNSNEQAELEAEKEPVVPVKETITSQEEIERALSKFNIKKLK